MNDLLKKLNVLVKASIHDVLGGSRRPAPGVELGKDIDREVAHLRERINDALAYEAELQTRAQALRAEVSRWDQQADDAVIAGNDSLARHAIDQMQRAQQRLAMAEADVRQHQRVTQELIQRVNVLEAAVADARRAKAETQSEAPGQGDAESFGQSLADVLRDAREKIAGLGEIIAAKTEIAAPSSTESVNDQAVDDDLETRRQRLSKPK